MKTPRRFRFISGTDDALKLNLSGDCDLICRDAAFEERDMQGY